MVSYHNPDAQSLIDQFKNGHTPWIISIGMVSEGTDIPRLQVCCHLSNVRTELYFRQVLGRILRITSSSNQEAWLYTFAEENLVNFAEGIEQDIPESCLYVKPQIVSEDELALPVRLNANVPSITPTFQDEVSWTNGFGQFVSEEIGLSYSSFTLGSFRERVIEAFSLTTD